MIRVNIVVEGPTEEGFIQEVVAPACWPHNIFPQARLVGDPGQKGGRVTFQRVAADVGLLLKQEGGTYCTTLLDFYGLKGPWPGQPLPARAPTAIKAAQFEKAVFDQVVDGLASSGCRADERFRPYFQMHEFEGLLFSDPVALARGLERPDLAPEFVDIRNQFACPEDINDGPQSAPSKRIIAHYSRYQKEKPLHGTLAAISVGLPAMLGACPRFNQWITWLTGLRLMRRLAPPMGTGQR